MFRPRLWVLLMPAAVFVMHGSPSAGPPAASPPVGQRVGADVGTTGPAHDVHGPLAVALGADEPAAPRDGTSAPGHDVSSHLWTACLAVLLAGVALVAAAVLRRRPVMAPTGALARAPERGTRWPLPRPPDLHVVCLLRT